MTTVAESALPRFINWCAVSTGVRQACIKLVTPLFTIPNPNSYEIQLPSMSIAVQEQLWTSEVVPTLFLQQPRAF